jgi:Tfp pilus assembly protein PilX
MKTVPKLPAPPRSRERGAALITVMLISLLLLLAGGALIMVTSMSAANAADATAESQAYYAAESGLQAALGVLRGNDAPNPLFNTTVTDPANKISFRKALSTSTSNAASDTYTLGRLSRWLTYDSTYTDRVVLSNNYTPMSGMAYTVDGITDPDASDTVTFSTAGAITGGTACTVSGTVCEDFGSGGNTFRMTYTPHPSTTLPTGGSNTASDLGTFNISSVNGTTSFNSAPYPTFTLTITQTAPWPMTVSIPFTISGSVSKSSGNVTVALNLNYPNNTSNPVIELGGVGYTPSGVNPSPLGVPLTTTNQTLSMTVSPPEPRRLVVKVKGYGPRNAVKRMQMLVSRSAFDYKASSAITIRSADDNTTAMTYNAGNSAQYMYNGYDSSNGPALPAFSVTGDPDYTMLNNLNSTLTNNNTTTQNQMQGSPLWYSKVPVSSLSPFLQTTDGTLGARALVDTLRGDAMKATTPGCDPLTQGATVCDRYFASGETPSDFGASYPNGLLTFVDGDVDLPPAGGAGLLVVTGTLTLNGSSQFDGLILVLGGGRLVRTGGGNGTSLGAVVVASFGTTGGFTAPTFNSNGSGNSTIRYDSEWVRKALTTAGPAVLGVSEY